MGNLRKLIDETIKLIEETRSELNQLGKKKPLTDPEVIFLSQKLDKLLNDYYFLTAKQKTGVNISLLKDVLSPGL